MQREEMIGQENERSGEGRTGKEGYVGSEGLGRGGIAS